MQHPIVVSLIGFFGSWAIVREQSCFCGTQDIEIFLAID